MNTQLPTNIHQTQTLLADQIKPCSNHICPLFNTCNYPKDKPCGYVEEYMLRITSPLLEILDFAGDEYLNQAVAMRLLPLYQHLALLKIEELSPGFAVTYTNKLGDIKDNPILKQTRETNKEIGRLEKELGITEMLKNRRTVDHDTIMKHGDKDYMDMMSNE